jgi:hypothetical protein
MDAGTIITLVISGLTLFAGGAWAIAKGKLGEAKNLIKEAYDVVQVAVEAIEDDKITKAEIEKIKSEALEVKVAARVLFKKKTV